MGNKRDAAKSVEVLRSVLMETERLVVKSVEVLLSVLMGEERIYAKPVKFPAHILKSYINAKKVAMSHLLKEN